MNSKIECLNQFNNYRMISSKYISELQFHEFEALVSLLLKVREDGAQVLIAGNGGSATTASHFATDLSVGTLKLGKLPLRAISLTDNLSLITAVANDLDYKLVFEQQIAVLGKPGDLLVLISASGNSENLIQALNLAVRKKMNIFTLTGFDGGKLKELSIGNNIHVQSMLGEYGLVEDLHLSICHMATECIRLINAN
jgi:D-sedoheptulose 7-phosphate isomerase